MTQSEETSIKRFNTIASEIEEWGAKNFKIHLPRWGVAEETGELVHCLLKRQQGIRGFDNYNHFRDKLADAIGDTVVYTLHALKLKGYKVMELPRPEYHPDLSDAEETTDFISQLVEDVGQLLAGAEESLSGNEIHDQLLIHMATAASAIDLELLGILEMVWNRVKTRDWTSNPENADKVAENTEQHSEDYLAGVRQGWKEANALEDESAVVAFLLGGRKLEDLSPKQIAMVDQVKLAARSR